MKVNLERLRTGVTNARNGVRYGPGEPMAALTIDELEALLAVVDAARKATSRKGLYGKYGDVTPLVAALEPFTSAPADRAWEEVDRWNAEQERRQRNAVVTFDAPQRLYPKPDPRPNPRDRARDQLADAGVTVQRQFRSDQERIAELEAELAAEVRWRRAKRRFKAHEVTALRERIAELERECDLRATESASANELITQIKDRLSRVPALVEAVRYCARPGAADSATAAKALAEWEKP